MITWSHDHILCSNTHYKYNVIYGTHHMVTSQPWCHMVILVIHTTIICFLTVYTDGRNWKIDHYLELTIKTTILTSRLCVCACTFKIRFFSECMFAPLDQSIYSLLPCILVLSIHSLVSWTELKSLCIYVVCTLSLII